MRFVGLGEIYYCVLGTIKYPLINTPLEYIQQFLDLFSCVYLILVTGCFVVCQ